MVRGSVPRGRQPQVGAAVTVRVPVDEGPVGLEVANADTVAERINIRTADIFPLKQPLPGIEEVSDDGVCHHTGGWDSLVLQEEELVSPRLVERALNRLLPDEIPTNSDFGLSGEVFAVVPRILMGVEEPPLRRVLARICKRVIGYPATRA